MLSLFVRYAVMLLPSCWSLEILFVSWMLISVWMLLLFVGFFKLILTMHESTLLVLIGVLQVYHKAVFVSERTDRNIVLWVFLLLQSSLKLQPLVCWLGFIVSLWDLRLLLCCILDVNMHSLLHKAMHVQLLVFFYWDITFLGVLWCTRLVFMFGFLPPSLYYS